MTDWCGCLLTASGSGADKFIADIGAQEGVVPELFEALVPLPEELKSTSVPPTARSGEDETQFQERRQRMLDAYGADNWYDWRDENWGVTRDVTADIPESADPTLVFETAYEPPLAWVQTISARYPATTFTLVHFEANAREAGWLTYLAGKMVEQYVYEGGWEDLENPDEQDEDDQIWVTSAELKTFLHAHFPVEMLAPTWR